MADAVQCDVLDLLWSTEGGPHVARSMQADLWRQVVAVQLVDVLPDAVKVRVPEVGSSEHLRVVRNVVFL